MPSQAAFDLCWVANSPSLVTGTDLVPMSSLELESVDDEHLAQFLTTQRQSRSVGRYFETLLHYWLAHVRGFEIVAHGLQLNDDKITVGEVDFLYRDEAGALVHCEASVKFFLCAPGTEPSEFPGPNARDNFEAKVTKLFDKQLQASVGRIDDVTHRLGVVKGMIFYRPGDPEAAVPERLCAEHLRGRWVRAAQLADLAESGSPCVLVDKPHWLAPVVDAESRPVAEVQRSLRAHFAADETPRLVSVRSADDPASEIDRCFVVSDKWPMR